MTHEREGDSMNILRIEEVLRCTGLSRTTIWRDVRADRFPAPLKIGRNRIGWREDEIDAWQDSLDRVWRPTIPIGDEAK